MIKAKQRIDKIEQKTGEANRNIRCRTIGVTAVNSRATRIWGKDHKDLPEHKKLIGMSLETARKTLRAYYEAEPQPADTLTINLEVTITDDVRDLPQDQGLGGGITDARPDTEIRKVQPSTSRAQVEPAEDPEKLDAPDDDDDEETREIGKMTNEELDREIELAEKELEK